jgi:hypothetical protein
MTAERGFVLLVGAGSIRYFVFTIRSQPLKILVLENPVPFLSTTTIFSD